MNLTNQKIIILLATYNGIKYIEQQLLSILNQRNVSFEMLIRDDGSTDETLDLAKDVLALHSNVHFLKTERESTGTPAGNFYKLLLSLKNRNDYEFVAFADQDDIWDADKLLKGIEKLGSNYSGYSSNLIAFKNDPASAWVIKKNFNQTSYDYIFQGASAGCTYILKKSLVDDVIKKIEAQNFDFLKKISHDWLVYAIARHLNHPWIMDDSSYIYYRQHASNSYGDNGVIANLIKKIKLIKSKWYGNQIRNILSVIDPFKNSRHSTIIFSSKSIFIRLWHIPHFFHARRKKLESIAIMMLFLIGYL
jgi:rhamnosyltransferase